MPTTTPPARPARAASLAALAAAAILAACGGDDPTGARPPELELPNAIPTTTVMADTTTPTPVDMLVWEAPEARSSSAARVIGPEGGTLELQKPYGTLRLVVPPNAVGRRTNFRITRLPGRIIAYDFGPHGATFAVPLRIEQDTRGTNIGDLGADAVVQAVYFTSAGLLDQERATTTVQEFMTTGVTHAKDKVVFQVDHFSGYGISTARRPVEQ